jgi:hypothetical protein
MREIFSNLWAKFSADTHGAKAAPTVVSAARRGLETRLFFADTMTMLHDVESRILSAPPPRTFHAETA